MLLLLTPVVVSLWLGGMDVLILVILLLRLSWLAGRDDFPHGSSQFLEGR